MGRTGKSEKSKFSLRGADFFLSPQETFRGQTLPHFLKTIYLFGCTGSRTACGIQFPDQESNPDPCTQTPALGVQNPSHWANGEVPDTPLLQALCSKTGFLSWVHAYILYVFLLHEEP